MSRSRASMSKALEFSTVPRDPTALEFWCANEVRKPTFEAGKCAQGSNSNRCKDPRIYPEIARTSSPGVLYSKKRLNDLAPKERNPTGAVAKLKRNEDPCWQEVEIVAAVRQQLAEVAPW
eukprot:g23563.t1